MVTATYELIQGYTLSSPGYFTFSSIPQNYKHLVLITQIGRDIAGGSGGRGYWIQFNGDTGSNYRQFYTYGTGGSSTMGSDVSTQTSQPAITSSGDVSTSYNPSYFEINNYSRNDQKKILIGGAGNGVNGDGGYATPNMRGAFFWNNINAITSISLTQATDNFSTGSTARLFGIAGDI